MNLRTFLQFWVDEKPNLACCLFASDEDLESDPDAYDCQGCAVADALGDLWPVNRAAWVTYRTVMTRFAYDTGTVALALERATREMDADDATDLLTRLALIYDEMNPIKVQPDGA